MGQGAIAESCIGLFESPEYSDFLRIRALVGDSSTFPRLKSMFPALTRVHLISNHVRNEDVILNLIESERIDWLISVQHPWILSAKLLQAVSGSALNLHNAKLPDYRGHNTISHAILNGDSTYTTTIHWMAPEVDLGPIACEETIAILPDDTSRSLYERCLKVATINFKKILVALVTDNEIPKMEILGRGRYYRKAEIIPLKEIQNLFDLDEVARKARAFDFPPHEPAYFRIRGNKYYVRTTI
jgi:methionyl-tRNA formyltransferase